MAKERTAIPRAVKDAVLSEFNHRCAVCSKDRPHIHHIDEDPGNNDPANLLPLCPNCHLTDEHNPTARIGAPRLRLFRRFKDPLILAPQFEALHARLIFFESIDENDTSDVRELESSTKELIEFSGALSMGSFYASRLTDLLKRPSHMYMYSMDHGYDYETIRSQRQHNREYRQQVRGAADVVLTLMIEQLRFQDWKPRPDASTEA